MEKSKHQLVHCIEAEFEKCVQVFRHIHQNPEIGLKETSTSAYLMGMIEKIQGVQIDPPLKGTLVETAIIARITVAEAIDTILLRCELDALNWKEKSGLAYSSVNELHHACGHDAHMATLFTALLYTAKNKQYLKRNVVFCFQPGEEGVGGASKLFKQRPDLLKEVDQCYAIHSHNAMYPGTIALAKGPITALSSRFSIKIQGVSSHPMVPNAGIDANYIGCVLVTQIYSLIGMKVPPLEGATMIVYRIQGGALSGKVSDNFQLKATLRVTTMDSYKRIEQTITQLAEGLCKAYGAKPTIQFDSGVYRPVVNDEKLTPIVRKKLQAAIEDLVVMEQQKSFAGEDFCEFSQRRPSCLIAVGSAVPGSIDPVTKQSKFPLHSPFHKIDEQVFRTSTKIWSTLIFT